jgi:outer membrane lipoprotein carrier protein
MPRSAQRKRLRRLPLSALVLAVPALMALASAGPPNTPETLAVRRMEQRYRSAKTLQATFLERYTENGRIVRSEAGTVYFRRPGRMRWEYESPENNLFLVDGKTAWFYVPADRTVTRVPAKESVDFRTPLALLAGEMKVSRVCGRVAAAPQEQPETPGATVISCILRDVSQAARATPENDANSTPAHDAIIFEVAQDSGDLLRLRIRDQGGVQVEFHFAAWHTDPPLPQQFFRFTVPPGVVIVNGELPPSAAPEHP